MRESDCACGPPKLMKLMWGRLAASRRLPALPDGRGSVGCSLWDFLLRPLISWVDMQEVNVGIVGLGNVGSSTLAILAENGGADRAETRVPAAR